MDCTSGLCLENLDRLDEAEEFYLRSFGARPDLNAPGMYLADFYVRIDRIADARAVVANATECNSDFNRTALMQSVSPFLMTKGDSIFENLRTAGLPE
jgi:hypothetical protein